jgi:general secretion pathway protein B
VSYILDALKKSEKKRMQGVVPDVLTTQETAYRESRTRRLWPYLIIAALLVNVFVLVWIAPWKSKKPVAVVETGVVTKLASKETGAVPASTEKPGISDAASVAQSDTAEPKSASVTKPLHDAGVTRHHQLAAARGEVQKTSAMKKSESAPKVNHDSAAEAPSETPAMTAPGEAKHPVEAAPIPGKVYSLSELPLSVQQKLPSFSISVFLYSDDPASRMVKINNKMLKEGDYLSEVLKLEEIDQNSLILSYQNFRFRVGLK